MASKKQFPLKVVIGAVDKITAPLARIRSKIQTMNAPFKKLGASLRQLGNAAGLDKLNRALRLAYSRAKRLAGGIASVAKRLAAAGTVGAFSVFKIVNGFANAGDTAAKTARAAGFTAEEFQELGYVADRNGVSQSIYSSSMLAFSKRLGEARAGTGGLYTMLNKTNPQLLRQMQAAESNGEAFRLLIGYMESLKSADRRAAIASAAFSRSGLKMGLIAKAGVSEMDRLIARAREFNLVIDEDSAEASEHFVDKMTNLKAALSGVRNIIGAGLMPILQDLIVRLTQGILDNQDRIKAWVKSFAESVPTFDQIRAGLSKVREQLAPFTEFMRWIIDNVGAGNALLIALAALIGGPLVLGLAGVTAAVWALGAALLGTPIGWFILGVTAIVAAVVALYKNLDKLQAGFGKIFEPTFERLYKIQKLIGKIISGAKSFGGAVLGFFRDDAEPQAASRARSLARRGVRSNEPAQAKVTVDFSQLPRGARVTADPKNDADVDLAMGWSVLGAS